MSRRKGTPCACEYDPCGSKKCIKAINNVSGDPNGDFEILAGVGIGISQSSDNSITIVNEGDPNAFIAGDNIEINPSGDSFEIRVTDDVSIHNLNVAGDIIQQGAAYETHAEKIYTTNDYIYMREGAVGGLASGSYAGFEVIKYDGTNDGRLVIDNAGVARVGDVGDEQPLLTREESANLNNGALLKWDAANLKAIDEGSVGSDTKPIKIVNGVATAVTDTLLKVNDLAVTEITGLTFNGISGDVKAYRSGNVVTICLAGANITAPNETYIITGLPRAVYNTSVQLVQWSDGTIGGLLAMMTGGGSLRRYGSNSVTNIWESLTYLTDQ